MANDRFENAIAHLLSGFRRLLAEELQVPPAFVGWYLYLQAREAYGV